MINRITALILGVALIVAAVSAHAQVPPEYGTLLVDIDEIYTPSPDDRGLYSIPPDDIATYKTITRQWGAVWSPDGKWIAYCDKYNLKNDYSPVAYSKDVICVVSAEGGIPTLVYQATTMYNGQEISWSGSFHISGFTQDSQELIITQSLIDEDRGSIVEINPSGSHIQTRVRDIFAINIYTGEKRLIVQNASNGIYSHDGQYFAYTTFPYVIKSERQGNIVLLDLLTNETTYLTDSNSSSMGFSPDDTYIYAAVEFDSGKREICRIATDGSGVVALTTPADYDFNVGQMDVEELSPDGRYLLYSVVEDDVYIRHLFALDLFTSEVFAFLPDSDLSTFRAVWSPDQSKICMAVRVEMSTIFLYVSEFAPQKFLKPYGEITAVEDEAPATFTLSGNYPNPFNPTTTIPFTLDKSAHTRLDVYNLNGQRIATLADAVMTPGFHSIVWNGTNDDGEKAGSGIYIVKLKAGNHQATKRLTIIK